MKGSPELKKIADNLERPPALDRIVSADMTEEEKNEVVLELKKRFDSQDLGDLKEGEVPLTQEQELYVKAADAFIDEELEHYGLHGRDLPPNVIHVLRPGQFNKFLSRRKLEDPKNNTAAITSAMDQMIVFKDLQQGGHKFFSNVVHEKSHLKSFISFNPVAIEGTEDVNIVARRLGWNIEETNPEGKTFFHGIDEAVIETLSVDIVRKHGGEAFGQEFDTSEKLRHALIEYIGSIIRGSGSSLATAESQKELVEFKEFLEHDAMFLSRAEEFLHSYESAEKDKKDLILLDALGSYMDKRPELIEEFQYRYERKFLRNLIATLYKENESQFQSEEDIERLFIKGGFDGNIMPVARLIEGTFRKGSFRKLGEVTRTGK